MTGRVIVFVGAPTATELLDTWSPHEDASGQAKDATPSNGGPRWRRLDIPDKVRFPEASPLEEVRFLSSSFPETQLHAEETRWTPHTPLETYIEQSFAIFEDEGPQLDVGERSHTILQADTQPIDTSMVLTLTPMPAYTFDIRIPDLEDLPSQKMIAQGTYKHHEFSILVAIIDIGQTAVVRTKKGEDLEIARLVVGDPTVSALEVSLWGWTAEWAKEFRRQDIILFEGLGLQSFENRVSASTRRNRTRCSLLYRTQRLHREDDQWRPNLAGHDEQTKRVRELRDWVLRFVHVGGHQHESNTSFVPEESQMLP
ncbi:hypothetical protein SAICODRAFT_35086 [Saitoella complicata NRRL Y-17804]|uniref:uncharacterized protein n=1 Tax=Saitoella complicata (strain BCRC 22490 / CBS 7301 / JCM 7358 / NBRC 10748 / NRRL Y-17804) TaxID=698492 RepID=UPI000866CBB6|nr:uncharacterized protein SAICODRAFT_35086 [Saitoella complicata NRRL Y-17804]ODQ53241.1 hypothetical protein SAICODRAFT_35086 [Saitoella complicata NRRL Y-17804]